MKTHTFTGFLEDLTSMPGKVTLRKVVERLQQTYCGTIGVEYMHIGSVEQCNWIRERVEHPSFLECDKEKKVHIFERLCFADTFENFLASKFNTTKRFGLDGGEAIIPALKDAIDRASELGAHSFIIGMPHRGRLNVLANVMRKPMTTIFSEFQGTHYDEAKFIKMKEDWGSSGDVKVSYVLCVVGFVWLVVIVGYGFLCVALYLANFHTANCYHQPQYHLGSSMDRTYPDGRKIHLSLLANPCELLPSCFDLTIFAILTPCPCSLTQPCYAAHLECVNPVVLGKARAKQFYCGDTEEDMRNVVPILLHGDAAFAGQGVVYETMQLMGVDDFKVGGTIHVIVNNQIGFTTNPINSRSTPYASDLGKAFNCPIFHCNGDDPVAVSRCLETAIEWRHEWGTDVIIDMICYRRNGHNELDQPM
jgi:2-oxoglutarate dehydrogenase E1 component